MDLHEEYIQRHNLDIPLIKYSRSSQLFLSSENGEFSERWRVIKIKWEEVVVRPGKFKFAYLKPLHDGFSKDGAFKSCMNYEPYYWDQYEKGIGDLVSYCKKRRYKAEITMDERMQFLWEIFLYVSDARIARMNKEVIQMAWRSLHDKDQKDRVQWIKILFGKLRLIDKSLMDLYEHYLDPLNQNYAEWLGKIINEQ